MDYADDRNGEQQGMDDDDQSMGLAEYTYIVREIELQPRWRARADKEADYGDGNQLEGELLQRMQQAGIPPAVEDQIGPALRAIQGYEAASRTDWRVTPNGGLGGQDVADAINYRLNEAERMSKADKACSDAFRSQIGPGLGWVEVSRNANPLEYPYRCTAIHRNEIHWDFHCKPDMSDARWLRRHRWLHPTRLASIFPEHRAMILEMGKGSTAWWANMPGAIEGGTSTGLSSTWGDSRGWTISEDRWYNPWNKDLCLSELWYRRWVPAILLKARDGRVIEYGPANPAHDMAIARGTVEVQRATVPRVRRSYWIGPHRVFDGPTPYTHAHFPYVPFWGFREDATNVPYGYTRSMIYQQDSLNSATAKARWGLSVVRVERTKGAVAMTDAQLRRQIARPDADIVLDPVEMAKPGARFEIHRDFQLTDQQFQLMMDARSAIERVSGISSGFQGKRGTATSGIQEQTQVEQSNQSLETMMDNFRAGRTMVGELLMAMIIEDIGDQEQEIVIEGDAINADRVVTLNKREMDPATNTPRISNDLMRTRLLVSLEDVPSTKSFRGQQLNALSEAVKSLPAQYQAAAMPFLASLMDVPFRKKLIEALRAAGSSESPEAIEKRVRAEVANELKARELDLKEAKGEAEIKKLVAEAVQVGVNSAFAAMQTGEKIAMNPMISPVGDVVMKQAGWQPPTPGGQDPNYPIPDQAAAVVAPGGEPGDTTPTTPQLPNGAAQGANNGVETLRMD